MEEDAWTALRSGGVVEEGVGALDWEVSFDVGGRGCEWDLEGEGGVAPHPCHCHAVASVAVLGQLAGRGEGG